MSEGLDGDKAFDERILHCRYYGKITRGRVLADRNGHGAQFWVGNIHEATRKRLAVSCHETHKGYGDSAKSAWNRDSKETERDSWKDVVLIDYVTNGEFSGGAQHAFCFLPTKTTIFHHPLSYTHESSAPLPPLLPVYLRLSYEVLVSLTYEA